MLDCIPSPPLGPPFQPSQEGWWQSNASTQYVGNYLMVSPGDTVTAAVTVESPPKYPAQPLQPSMDSFNASMDTFK